MPSRLDHVDLNGDNGDGVAEKLNHVEEATGDALGHKDSVVLSLWPASLLVVPIFNRADDMGLVRLAQAAGFGR